MGVPNEKPYRGGVGPVEALLRHDATPIKLHVTTDVLLRPGYGT